MRKKRLSKKILIIATLTLAALFLLLTPLAITCYLYNQAFGLRVDTANDFYDFIQEEHPEFIRYETSFPSDQGQRLAGYFYGYPQADYKGLIVLAHGMSDGQNSYIAESEYLARNGYLVFAYDCTGTNKSSGEKLIGLSQSAIDLKYALDYLATLKELSPLPFFLYGHSWGGFAVTAVNNYELAVEIQGIVSVAGFEESNNVFFEQGSHIFGPAISLFLPYVGLYERFLFGENANYTGIDGLNKTKAHVLIIHSKDDPVVNYQDNFLAYQEAFAQNPRFTFLALSHHGHNATLEPQVQEKIALIEEQRDLLSPDEETLKYLALAEKKLTLELDQSLMDTIVQFYDGLITR